MPLDLSNATAPRTIGRRKTKEEIRQELSKKYDVKSGLREQGGFVSFDSPWEKKKREEYKRLLALEDDKDFAHFGELPDGWSYFSKEEMKELSEGLSPGAGPLRRVKNLYPIVWLKSGPLAENITIEVSNDSGILNQKVSYSNIYSSSDDVMDERLRYEINKTISIFAGGSTDNTIEVPIEHG